MTKKQRDHLLNLVLSYGESTRNTAIAMHLGDKTATSSKETNELIDYIYSLEVCNDKQTT